MQVNYEKSGAFRISDATVSYTVIFNSDGGEYAESPHHHSAYELQYFVTDGWTLTAHTGEVPLPMGSVCFIPPFEFHHFTPSSDSSCRKISVKFSVGGNEKKRDSAIKKINDALSTVRNIEYLTDERISFLLSLLSQCPYENYKNESLVCSIVCAVILYLIDTYEQCSHTEADASSRMINDREHLYAIHIEDYIATNYKSADVSLHTLADTLHLSDRQTERLCSKIFGASFSAMLARQRMTVAEALINENKHSLSEISELVGYNSYTGFYKSYKKFYNKSPKN